MFTYIQLKTSQGLLLCFILPILGATDLILLQLQENYYSVWQRNSIALFQKNKNLEGNVYHVCMWRVQDINRNCRGEVDVLFQNQDSSSEMAAGFFQITHFQASSEALHRIINQYVLGNIDDFLLNAIFQFLWNSLVDTYTHVILGTPTRKKSNTTIIKDRGTAGYPRYGKLVCSHRGNYLRKNIH